MDNRRITILLLLCALVIPLVIWGLFSIFNQRVSTGVRFLVTPDNVTVSYSGESIDVSYGKEFSLSPGEYTLNLSRNGFDSHESVVVIEPGTIKNICVSLTPNSLVGKEILANQKDLAARSEGVFGCQVEQGGEAIEEEYPFVKNLPIIDKYFSATACKDSGEETSGYIICISMVTLNDFHKNRAKTILKENGIDISSVKLNFFKPSLSH